MQDKNIKNDEKVVIALSLFYKELVNAEKQLDDVIWFYTKGKKVKDDKTKSRLKKNQLIYSYEYDADLIFAAFSQNYGINLNTENLHWWEFKSLFEGLTDKTKFVEIMGYRAVDLSKISDKKEKERYRKLKDIYKLPDMRSQEEKEADFSRAFW